MQRPRRRKNRFKMPSLHRYAGLTAAFLAVLLSITGILLNHTEELKLHDHSASTPWLLGLYGIKAPDIKTAYAINPAQNKSWVIEFSKEAYLNDRSLDCQPPLIGAIATDELIIVSNPAQLCLFTHQGELIDVISPNADKEIIRLGKSDEGLAIVDTGIDWLTLNTDYTELITTQKNTDSSISWVVSSSPPPAFSDRLIKKHKGEGLPWERVILDLHSGRIVGLAGVYFMDFIALLMIFLAITGVLMWWKRRGGGRRRAMKKRG